MHGYTSFSIIWSAVAEWFSVSDLCSDGRVVRMWVHFTVIASLHPGVNGYL